MPDHRRRFDSMLFNYESSMKTDYRPVELKYYPKTSYKEGPSCSRLRPTVLKDLHSLTEWKNAIVPFNLYHKPKEVVRTNPRVIQEHFHHPIDADIDLVEKTRPRLVMTPAASLDDIEDKNVRNRLIEDIYKSSATKTTEVTAEKAINRNAVRAPLRDIYAPCKPIKLAGLKLPYVSPEWRMDSVTWDNRQLRTYTDPDQQFWLARTPKCDACDFTSRRHQMKRRRSRI